jgi:cell division protein FtsQ
VAGSTTAERGERQQRSSGPPPARRLRRRHVRVIVILGLTLVFLGIPGVWLFYGSDWLRAEHVSVSGTRVLTPAQVEAAADVPLGDPLVSVDTGAIEARVRRELPRIDSVDAVRSWPHGIDLEVVERTPVLVVHTGGKFVEVDDEGVRFATVPKAPKGVPELELTLSRSGSAAASLRRFGESRLVREAVAVARAVPAAVARDTRTVKVRSYDDISLELRDGRTVAWGSSEKGPAKARTLTALMKATPDAGYFDVSVPTAPASSGS